MAPDLPDEHSQSVEVLDEEMPEVQPSPEVQIISSKGAKSPPPPKDREREPYVGGYADQWKRKATPVHVDPEVQVRSDIY